VTTTPPPSEGPSQAQAQADDRLQGHLSSAGELMAGRHFRQAEVELLRALSSTPSDVRALNLLALVRFKLGKLEEARSTYREVASLRPDDGAVQRNLGLLSLKLERFADAAAELERATRLTPGDLRAWSYLGYALTKRGDRGAAAAAFRRGGQELLAAQLESSSAADPGGVAPTVAGETVSVDSAAPLPSALESLPAETAPVIVAARGPQAVIDVAPVPAPALSPEVLPEVSLEAPPLASPAVSLVSFALASLGLVELTWPAPFPARLVLQRDAHAHVRRDAAVACAGAPAWHPAFRRVRGRTGDVPLGTRSRGFFRLSGAGELLVAGRPGQWLALALEDDILYLRERCVLAFDDGVSWEAGRIPGDGLRLLQFRGRGRVMVEFKRRPTAIQVIEGRPVFVPRARLLGWVGHIVVHGRRPADPLFQVQCEGEGVILLDVAPVGLHHSGAA
jgi:tetratricopeptide (TPR) repeat protein